MQTHTENEHCGYWFVSKEVFHSSVIITVHPDKANSQADHPSQRLQGRLIYVSLVTWGKKIGVGLDAHARIVVIAMWLLGCRVMTDSLMLFCHNLCHPWLPEDAEHYLNRDKMGQRKITTDQAKQHQRQELILMGFFSQNYFITIMYKLKERVF